MYGISMITSETRLKGKSNFALFAHARHFRGTLVRAACVRRPSGSGIKIAFVAGKKVSAKAVDRNKIKRRLRELGRRYHHALPPDIWLMVIALPEAMNASFASLEADFEALFGQIATKNASSRRN
jgi:ribonuclease P protein component